MVSVREVAAAAGVSVGTVSNVLNRPERVSPAVAQRVHEAIDALGYVRNDAARQLRSGRSTAIGMVVLDVRNPFFTDVARGAERRAAEAGLTLFLGNSDEDADREAMQLDLFEQQRVYGLLITPVGRLQPRLERLQRRGTPVVLLDREVPGSVLPAVAVDDVAGGELAVRHLLALGRRRIAFVGGADSIQQVADRWSGAVLAAERVADASLERIATGAMSIDEGVAAGLAIRRRLAADRPDAVFAANDLLALGVLQALLAPGGERIRVPEEIALIGYDDIVFAAGAVVPLSSIRQPAQRMGAAAVELLLRVAADDQDAEGARVAFEPELVVRASTEGDGASIRPAPR